MAEEGRPTLKSWLVVACLGLVIFIFVTTSLMPMGLLPDIAAGIGRSEAFTGLLVTGYAWVAALLTLPLTMLAARFDRRSLLMAVLALFVLSHFLAWAASGFWSLFTARVLSAVAHAVLWGLATPTAVRLAPAGRSATVLAIMATGVSLAAIVGVPLGTWLGQQLGWRMAFLAVGLLAMALMALLAVLLPSVKSDNLKPLKNLSLISGRPALWRIYIVMLLSTCGHAAAFTYFTPFMKTVAGVSPEGVVNYLLLFGLAGVAGSFLIGPLSSRYNPAATVAILALMTVNLSAASQLALSSAGIIVLCLLWGSLMSGVGILYQSVLFKTAPEATDLGMAIFAVFFNLGIGGGALVGGRIFEHYSITAAFKGGAVFMAAALAVYLISIKIPARAITSKPD